VQHSHLVEHNPRGFDLVEYTDLVQGSQGVALQGDPVTDQCQTGLISTRSTRTSRAASASASMLTVMPPPTTRTVETLTATPDNR